MQYSTNLQSKGALEVSCIPSSIVSGGAKFKKDGNFEPISVLDTRSPSPSTSTSTLSSSFGGTNCGGGNTESTVAMGSLTGGTVVLPLHEPTPTAADANGGGGGAVTDSQKEEWVAELQGLQAGLELIQQGAEKSSLGLDWDSILSESAAGGQDQSLLKWIYSDVVEEDSPCNLKQFLLQGGGGNSNEIVDGSGVFGAVLDQSSSAFDAFAATPGGGGCGGGVDSSSGTGNVSPTINSGRLSFSGSELCVSSSNNNLTNGKFEAVPNSNSSNSNNGYPQNQNFAISQPNNLLCGVPNVLNIAHHQQLQFAAIEQHNAQNLIPMISSNKPQFQNGPQSFNLLNPLLSCPSQDHQPPQPKRQNLGIGNPLSASQLPTRVPTLDPETASFLRNQQQQLYLGLGQQLNLIPHDLQRKQPKLEVPDGIVGSPMVRHQQQLVYDQLYKATELILAGNFSHAQGILARLNHQLSPAVKPFQRAAFYVKEALQMLLLMPPNHSWKVPNPLDGLFKMGAYKMFSEVSPFLHFINFTSNQAILEALDEAENIHIIDFDFGCGAQWSSFMQELPKKNRGSASLKITAFASPSAYHPIEISLVHESLSEFANDLGIKFELVVVNFDSFDPATSSISSFRSSPTDIIAVNFPLWSVATRPAILPSLLCFIKQLSPIVMVMLDQGCERFDLPPSHHLLNALQYYEVLLDSIDAVNMAPDSAKKIETFLIQTRIQSIVFGRLQSPNQIPPGSNLLASAGFSTLPVSNFIETQAECLLKRTPVRGFHVEKRHASLVLCWQHCEVMSASIWKC